MSLCLGERSRGLDRRSLFFLVLFENKKKRVEEVVGSAGRLTSF